MSSKTKESSTQSTPIFPTYSNAVCELTIGQQKPLSAQSLTKVTDLKAINDVLTKRAGACILPLDLTNVPSSIKNILDKPDNLSPEDSKKVREHFTLSRECFLKNIAESKRSPHVQGGGLMQTTHVANERCAALGVKDKQYPALFDIATKCDGAELNCMYEKIHVDCTALDEKKKAAGNNCCASGGADVQMSLVRGCFTWHLALDYVQQGKNSEIARIVMQASPSQGFILVSDGAVPHSCYIAENCKARFVGMVAGPSNWRSYSAEDHCAIPKNPFCPLTTYDAGEHNFDARKKESDAQKKK